MKQIQFLGNGPSAREINNFYHDMDVEPPVFIENYPGELNAMYQANGYEQVYGVYTHNESPLTLRQSAMRLQSYCLAEQNCLFGPLIIEEKVVIGGFAWWLKR